MITIAVFTHNEGASLVRTLACLTGLEPVVDFKALVVDNRSDDDTRGVVARCVECKSNVRYVYEHELGVAHARSRAVEEARGDVIAFVDDDQTVARNWLAAIAAAFSDPSLELTLSPLCTVDERGRQERRSCYAPLRLLLAVVSRANSPAGVLTRVDCALARAIRLLVRVLFPASLAAGPVPCLG